MRERIEHLLRFVPMENLSMALEREEREMNCADRYDYVAAINAEISRRNRQLAEASK